MSCQSKLTKALCLSIAKTTIQGVPDNTTTLGYIGKNLRHSVAQYCIGINYIFIQSVSKNKNTLSTNQIQ